MRLVLLAFLALVSFASAEHLILTGGPALRKWENLRVPRDQHDRWWANFVRASTLRTLLPFAASYGMETGMTIDAVRAGYRVAEIEADLAHRATGKTLGGFAHRARQLRDILAAYLSRRRG